MIIIDCKQGSARWHEVRLGIPTSSGFSNIITPKERKPSKSAEKYASALLSAWITGIPADAAESQFMQRGTELEPKARRWYEFDRGVTVRQVGFCLLDDHSAGCSPDGLVGDDGLLQIKCPGAAKHIENLIEMTDDHFTQVQGEMFVTGRKWCDLLSYHPEMPPAVARIERDETYLAALQPALAAFTEKLEARRRLLLEKGCKPAAGLAPEFAKTLHD